MSGAVEGKAVWPQDVKPVAWHEDANTVRMKLGLYHKTDLVHDGEVEYRDISIKGPNGELSIRDPSNCWKYLFCFVSEQQPRALGGSFLCVVSANELPLRVRSSLFYPPVVE